MIMVLIFLIENPEKSVLTILDSVHCQIIMTK